MYEFTRHQYNSYFAYFWMSHQIICYAADWRAARQNYLIIIMCVWRKLIFCIDRMQCDIYFYPFRTLGFQSVSLNNHFYRLLCFYIYIVQLKSIWWNGSTIISRNEDDWNMSETGNMILCIMNQEPSIKIDADQKPDLPSHYLVVILSCWTTSNEC